MRTLKLIVAVLLAIALMVIAAANMQPVDLRLLPHQLGLDAASAHDVPLALVIIAALAVGFLVGELVEFTRERKHRAQLAEKRREIGRLREENDRLNRRLGTKNDELALIQR